MNFSSILITTGVTLALSMSTYSFTTSDTDDAYAKRAALAK